MGDSGNNRIFGNLISGSGQLGAGQMTLGRVDGFNQHHAARKTDDG